MDEQSGLDIPEIDPGCKHIVMLLSNAFRPDVRVLKEMRSLIGFGYHVTVIAWDRSSEMAKKEEISERGRIIRIQSVQSKYGIGAKQLLRLPLFWRAIVPILDTLKPDLVHCHDFDTLPAGLWWAKRNNRPVIYDAHEYFADMCKPRLNGFTGRVLYQAIRTAEKFGARNTDAIVTVDENLARIFRRLNNRVIVIGHYPTKKLAIQPSRAFSRNDLTLLYLGRISTDRGMLVYLEILRQLTNRKIPARLVLAGEFIPDEERLVFEKQSVSIRDCIEILGWVEYDQLTAILQKCDLGMALLQPLPRYQAALPVKLFEYMAGGLPIIASNFPPIEEILKDSNCGVTIDPQISEAAVQQITSWWEERNEPNELGENGRQAVLDRYNWESLVAQLDALYQTLLF